MFKIKNTKSKIIAFLVYAPSTLFIPHIFYALFLYQLKNIRSFKVDKNIFIIISIIVLSFLNQIIVGSVEDSISKSTSDYIPYSFFILISILIAQNSSKEFLKLLLILVLIEIGFGILEYAYGTRSFFLTSAFEKADLIYYNKVLGLSENSSVFAYKIFVGLLITNYLYPFRKNKLLHLTLSATLFIGLIITFNRTIIISTIIFYGLTYRKFFLRIFLKPLTLIIIVGVIIAIYNEFSENIILQFTRGMTLEDTASGRFFIWTDYIEFIRENLFFGNGSVKRWIVSGERVFHAHNSYIQTLATNGIFIFLLYLWFILRNIKKSNHIYVIPFLIGSMTQYFLLWGISMWDIVFYYFLLNTEFNHKSENVSYNSSFEALSAS